MAMNISDLADVINLAIGATDKDGVPISVTPEMEKYAEAVITTLQAGLVNHATGTVNGVTAPGAPLALGAALGGLISNLLPTTWMGVMSAAIPLANPAQLLQDATQSTTYLTASSLVNFLPGAITGTCTNTPVSPGPLTNGAGSAGLIVGLAGAPWAAAVMPPGGNPILTQNIYNAIAGYILANAECEYLTGSVVGVCPAAGGPLTAGTGLNGTVA
jgi:hypothetical protein